MPHYTLVFPREPNTVPKKAPTSNRLMSLSFHRAVEAYLIEQGEPECILVSLYGRDDGGAYRKELIYRLSDASIIRMVTAKLTPKKVSKRKR